jgi:hypothetical protein
VSALIARTNAAGSANKSGCNRAARSPAHAKTAHQTAAPTVVTSENPPNGIRTNPAGIEITCRTTGNNRAKKIPVKPNLRIKTSPRSTLAPSKSTHRPHRSRKLRPTILAAKYVNADPTQEPNVPAITTPTELISPRAAKNAAGGITTSLGTGKIELSIAIKIATPQYPHSRTQPNQVTNQSCIIKKKGCQAAPPRKHPIPTQKISASSANPESVRIESNRRRTPLSDSGPRQTFITAPTTTGTASNAPIVSNVVAVVF